jgi:hypothetical protein
LVELWPCLTGSNGCRKEVQGDEYLEFLQLHKFQLKLELLGDLSCIRLFSVEVRRTDSKPFRPIGEDKGK